VCEGVAEGVVADDVLRRKESGGEKEDRAGLFLLEVLADGDWHESADVKELAAANEISQRTLQRTAKDLGVEYDQRGFR
jgi:hypothetical protein